MRRPAAARAAGLVWLMLAGPALPACRVEADSRLPAQRLASAPLAFVGTVRSVDAAGVVFTVELTLHGPAAPEYRLVRPPGPCDHPFMPGERWLFAGAAAADPSLRLGEASLPLARHLARLDDSRLALPDDWQRCDDAAQCVAIDNGCLPTAVHRDHLAAATQRARSRGGDPRAMSCEPLAPGEFLLACVASRCGAWRLRTTSR